VLRKTIDFGTFRGTGLIGRGVEAAKRFWSKAKTAIASDSILIRLVPKYNCKLLFEN